MKTYINGPHVKHRYRNSKLVALCQSNKQNLQQRLFTGRIVAPRNLPRQQLTPTNTKPKQNRYSRQESTLPTITSNQLLPSRNPLRRHCKTPSVKLPTLNSNNTIPKVTHKIYTQSSSRDVANSHSHSQFVKYLNKLVTKRHQRHFSIDNEFTKLESLTKRGDELQRDLISVQTDLISLHLTSAMQDAANQEHQNSIV